MGVDINILAVLVAAGVHAAIGFLWYSPVLFGKVWIGLMGFDVKTKEGKEGWEKQKKATQKTWIPTVLGALILSYALAYFMGMFSVKTISAALQIGFIAWLSFIATPSFLNTLFIKQSKKLWAINTCYPLCSMLIMSIIFVLWQ